MNANAWRNNPKRGKRPVVKKLSMLLHPELSYRIKDGYVEIIGGMRLRIIGWDRRYDDYKNREARLVYKKIRCFYGYLRGFLNQRNMFL
jgi:hypothetical protein